VDDEYEFKGHGPCPKCGKNVLWFRTTGGKNMPVNDTRALTEEYLDPGDKLPGDDCRAFCHFDTCPQGKRVRGF